MTRTRILASAVGLAAALCAPGCWLTDGGATTDAGLDGAVENGDAASAADGGSVPADAAAPVDGLPAGDGGGGTISIYVAGDATPRTFSDGLSGQTPRDFRIALSTYYAMTSATDPAPALCFDHGADEVVADLAGDTRVGTCARPRSRPRPTPTAGVRVAWAEYTVSGVLHYLGASLAGDFTFFRAYSDTVHNGTPMSAGQGVIRFSATGTEIPVTYPSAEGSAAAPLRSA
jgi:hypothetical protein